jgi:hypothetical protein
MAGIIGRVFLTSFFFPVMGKSKHSFSHKWNKSFSSLMIIMQLTAEYQSITTLGMKPAVSTG